MSLFVRERENPMGARSLKNVSRRIDASALIHVDRKRLIVFPHEFSSHARVLIRDNSMARNRGRSESINRVT